MQTTNPEEIKRKQEEGKIEGSKLHNCISLELMKETVNLQGISEEQIKKLKLSDKKLISYLKQPLSERVEEALIGFENWFNEFKPITISNELMVYSKKHLFAGTLDWIGYLWDKKKKKYDLWLVDWKISKVIDRSYDLQITSYWKAFSETYRKNIPSLRLGILQLGKNKCGYSFKEVKDKKVCWDLFLNTKNIWNDTNNKIPEIKERRETFSLPVFSKKGRMLKI
jgi:hypothetical protein